MQDEGPVGKSKKCEWLNINWEEGLRSKLCNGKEIITVRIFDKCLEFSISIMFNPLDNKLL